MPGATTQYSFPYPIGSDPLGDGEDSVQALAEAVEGWMRVVMKSADETVNASTVLQDDDHLVIPLEAGATYIIDGGLFWNASPVDAKIAWAYSGSAAVMQIGVVNKTDTLHFQSLASAQVLQTPMFAVAVFGMFTTTTAGNLRLRWAQNVSDVGDTILQRGSYLRVQRQA